MAKSDRKHRNHLESNFAGRPHHSSKPVHIEVQPVSESALKLQSRSATKDHAYVERWLHETAVLKEPPEPSGVASNNDLHTETRLVPVARKRRISEQHEADLDGPRHAVVPSRTPYGRALYGSDTDMPCATSDTPHQRPHVASSLLELREPRRAKDFARRKRRKTRENHYDYQHMPSDRARHSKEAKNQHKQTKQQNKTRAAKRDGQHLFHSFESPNLGSERLTQPSRCGLFNNGHSSAPIQQRGVPDLTFSEMKFLRRRHDQGPLEPEKRKSQQPQDIMSEFFKIKPLPSQEVPWVSASNVHQNKPHSEPHGNLVEGCQRSDTVQRNCSSEGVGQAPSFFPLSWSPTSNHVPAINSSLCATTVSWPSSPQLAINPSRPRSISSAQMRNRTRTPSTIRRDLVATGVYRGIILDSPLQQRIKRLRSDGSHNDQGIESHTPHTRSNTLEDEQERSKIPLSGLVAFADSRKIGSWLDESDNARHGQQKNHDTNATRSSKLPLIEEHDVAKGRCREEPSQFEAPHDATVMEEHSRKMVAAKAYLRTNSQKLAKSNASHGIVEGQDEKHNVESASAKVMVSKRPEIQQNDARRGASRKLDIGSKELIASPRIAARAETSPSDRVPLQAFYQDAPSSTSASISEHTTKEPCHRREQPFQDFASLPVKGPSRETSISRMYGLPVRGTTARSARDWKVQRPLSSLTLPHLDHRQGPLPLTTPILQQYVFSQVVDPASPSTAKLQTWNARQAHTSENDDINHLRKSAAIMDEGSLYHERVLENEQVMEEIDRRCQLNNAVELLQPLSSTPSLRDRYVDLMHEPPNDHAHIQGDHPWAVKQRTQRYDHDFLADEAAASADPDGRSGQEIDFNEQESIAFWRKGGRYRSSG